MTGSPEIFFVTRKWPPATGGMETWSLRLSEELQELRSVQIVKLSGELDGMPPRKTRLLTFALRVFREWFTRKNSPRILQIGDLALWPFGLLAPKSTRVFIAAHGTDAAYHRRGGIRGSLYGCYLRVGAHILRRATILANSRATREVVAERGWRHIEIIYLGTDFRSPAAVSPPSKHVLFAGRLVERKGCGWFVREVLPLLPDEIMLDIAGTAWDESEKEILEHPRVTLLGNLDQAKLAEAYAESLCVILPNIDVPSGEFEGFGLVAPEAAAAGGVVLAADRDGLRDAVEDKVTGFLLPTGNAVAWRDAICSIYSWSDEERRTHVFRSRKAATKRYSWQRVAYDTVSAYGI